MITLRPIGPRDARAFQAFIQGLSMQARLNRFLFPVKELGPSSLAALTQADQRGHVGLVALEGDRIVGEARYVELGDTEHAEFALAVADERQRRGVGTLLLGALMEAAERASVIALEGEILRSNTAMLEFMRRKGFRLKSCLGDARLLVAERLLAAGYARTSPRSESTSLHA
jgi:acetyltransferase